MLFMEKTTTCMLPSYCSKCVHNATLQFVNSPIFNVDYILLLGESNLKKEIQHLGMGNKNTSDIILMIQQIKKYMEECGHFPCMLSVLTWYDGVGTKIASLVLYFAYGQNNAIPVDSHVIKCAIALKWVPDFCKSPEAVWTALQQWIPLYFWPHANMVLASLGQLFSKIEMAKNIWEIACQNAMNVQ